MPPFFCFHSLVYYLLINMVYNPLIQAIERMIGEDYNLNKLLRKSLSIIMALSLVLSFSSVAAAAPGKIKFKLWSIEGRPGQSIHVTLTVDLPADNLFYEYTPYVDSSVPITEAYWGQWEDDGTRVQMSIRIAEDAPSGDYPMYFDLDNMWVKKGTTRENVAFTTDYDTEDGVITVKKQVSVGHTSGSAGGYVEVPVSTNSTEPISAYKIKIPYDSSVLEVVDVTAAEEGMIYYEDEEEDDVLVVEWNNNDSSVLLTNRELFKMKFKINGDTPSGQQGLPAYIYTFSDEFGEQLSGVDSQIGYITITENQPPSAGNVNVIGTPQIGETLHGNYSYLDAEFDEEGVSTYQWYRANNAAGAGEQPIAGADAKTYVLQSGDKDKYIRFEVTPIAITGAGAGTPVKSAWTGPIGVPTYQVLYEANGATQGDVPVDTTAYETGQEATVLGNTGNLVKTEHTFGGWTTDEANLGTIYMAGDSLPIESMHRTLYAKWVVNRYPVSFHSNGGSAVPSVTADYNSLIAEPQRPTRSGYSFNGWYKNEELTERWTFTSDKVVANTMLYAKWSPNSQGGGGGVPTPSEPSEQSLSLLINGRGESLAKADTKTENGRKTTVVSIDEAKLESELNEEKAGGTLTVPVAVLSDSVMMELKASTVKALQHKDMVIELQTPSGTYSLPASHIDLAALSERLGSNVPTEEIKVRLKIAKTSEDQEKAVQDAIAKEGLTLVGEPLEFTVEVSYGDRSAEIESFSSYVERSIVLPGGTDAYRITTGVAIDPDGTVRHVPTKIIAENGKHRAIINSLTNSTYAVVWHPVSFADAARHWAKDAVNEMGSRLIISGIENNQIKPDLAVSRAEFTAIIVSALGFKSTNEAVSSYSDVSASAWFSGAIESAKSYHLVGGFEDGTFRPSQELTREQAVVILMNAMELTGLKQKHSLSSDAMQRLDSFTDTQEVSEWAREAMAIAVEAKLVTGHKDNRLAPQSYITRAEVATIIRRLLEQSNLI
ncbi:hypothetical protein D3P09_13085 [Paenibacillus pinisoli]|uniref:SLH domain-containing protein n=1 Tax=Paenibacillus pinisoli TaxID=1276110 RepID=A0A3A6Q2U4_9BACL|nr:hypothetical protein D3P09_13085 [Paenibacillus pinisoli]